MKIKTKIILVFSILCATAALGVYFVFVGMVSRLVVSQTNHTLEEIALSRGEQTGALINKQKNSVIVLASNTIIQKFLLIADGKKNAELKDEARAFLQKIGAMDKGYNEVILLDAKGRVALSSDPSREGVDSSSDPYFINGKTSPFIKSPYFSKTTGRFNYAISAPVFTDGTEQYIGVVVIRFNMDELNEIMSRNAGLAKSEEIFLIDGEKKMITRSRADHDDVIGSKIETMDAANCFLDNGAIVGHEGPSPSTSFIDHRGVKSLGTTVSLHEVGWCLIVKVDADEALALTKQTKQSAALYFSFGVLFFIVSGYFVAKSIVRPIERLSLGAQMMGRGDLHYRVGTDDPDEVGDLSRSVDSMAKRLREMSENVGKKVEEQTKELWKKHTAIQEQQVAMLNVLDDVKKLKANYYELLENSRDGIIVVDVEGNLVWVSSVVEKMYDISSEKTKGLPFSGLLDPSSADKVRQDFPRIFQGTFVVEEYLTATSSGKKYWVEVMGRKTEFEGKTVAFLQLRDITEKKRAELMIRTEKEKLEKYFEILSAIILIIDAKGEILLMNKQGAKILGGENTHFIGKNWVNEFVSKSAEPHPEFFLKEMKKTDGTQYFEQSIPVLNGESGKEVRVAWGRTAIFDEKDVAQAYLMVGENITALREAEASVVQLKAIDNLKDEFLNIATHELKTPLTAIIGLSEVIGTKKDMLPPDIAHLPDIIHSEGLRLSHIVKRILTITRYESGKETTKMEPLKLGEYFDTLRLSLEEIVKARGAHISIDVKDPGMIIESDKEKVSEVVMNLVDNALKYGNDGQTISVVASRLPDHEIQITVTDQGKGIPSEKVNRLFNKFSQLEPSFSRTQEGIGLGLYICKLIVERLGGRIGVESEIGKGTTFYMIFKESISEEKNK